MLIYIQQNGSVGKSIPYPSSAHPNATIATSGCGVCSSLMALENSTSYSYALQKWTKWIIKIGGRVAGGTNMHTVTQRMAKSFGLTVKETTDISELKKHIKKGYKAIAHVGQKGYFAWDSKNNQPSGHFICVAGYSKEGKAIVLDPYYYANKWTTTVHGINRSKYFKYNANTHEVTCAFDVINRDRRSGGKFYLLTPTKKIKLRYSNNDINTKIKDGIDTSKYNHGTKKKVNFSTVDCGFAIPRVGYRGWAKEGALVTDPYFKSDMDTLIKRGIPVGVYWFAQEITKAEAKEAADYVYKLIKNYKLNLPVYYDSEMSTASEQGKVGRADKLSKAVRTEVTLAFVDRIREHGYRAGVYASESWFKEKLDFAKIKAKGCSIWVAKYGLNTSIPGVKPNLNTYDIWQYTSKGKMTGVTGGVDLNRMVNNIIEYNPKVLTSSSTSSSKPAPTTSKVSYFKKYTGKSSSIVDALKAVGCKDTSLAYRKKIAKANNIKSYEGTIVQNTKMLNLLKKGKLIKP